MHETWLYKHFKTLSKYYKLIIFGVVVGQKCYNALRVFTSQINVYVLGYFYLQYLSKLVNNKMHSYGLPGGDNEEYM